MLNQLVERICPSIADFCQTRTSLPKIFKEIRRRRNGLIKISRVVRRLEMMMIGKSARSKTADLSKKCTTLFLATPNPFLVQRLTTDVQGLHEF